MNYLPERREVVLHPMYFPDLHGRDGQNPAYSEDNSDSLPSSSASTSHSTQRKNLSLLSISVSSTSFSQVEKPMPDYPTSSVNASNDRTRTLLGVATGQTVSGPPLAFPHSQQQRGNNLSLSENTGNYPISQQQNTSGDSPSPSGLLVKPGPRKPYVPPPTVRSDSSSNNSRNPCRRVMIVFLITGVASLAGTLSRLLSKSSQYQSTADIVMRVNQTYMKDMHDSLTPMFRSYSETFCHTMTEATRLTLEMDKCRVISLSNGSIIVQYEMVFHSENNLTQTQLERAVVESGIQLHGPFLRYGHLTVFPDIRVVLLSTVSLPATLTTTTTTRTDIPVMIPSTSPNRITSQPAATTQTTVTRDDAPTSSVDPARSDGSIDSTMPPASKGHIQMDSTPKPPDVTDSQCTRINSKIWSNQSSLYACNDTGVYVLPQLDTYPENCWAFQWCVNGQVYDSQCAARTHFILSAWNQLGPMCGWPADSRTFCKQMSRTVDCKKIHPGGNIAGRDVSLINAPDTATVPSRMTGFECAGLKMSFTPAVDTYPCNCSSYQQCVDNRPWPMHCPGGLHFTLEDQVCVPATSTDPPSYCQVRKKLRMGDNSSQTPCERMD